MPDKERKVEMAVSAIVVVCMLICANFGWPRSPHASAWHIAIYTLGLVNSTVTYGRLRNSPVPDMLIKLFPKSTQQSPGRP